MGFYNLITHNIYLPTSHFIGEAALSQGNIVLEDGRGYIRHKCLERLDKQLEIFLPECVLCDIIVQANECYGSDKNSSS